MKPASTWKRRVWWCWLASILLTARAPAHPAATGDDVTEYEVKAAMLYNFPKFVEWPGTPPADAPFLICAFGEDPLNNYLSAISAGKMMNGRRISFVRVRSSQAAAGCQMVFIGSSERRQIASIVQELEGQPVLTVGNTDGYLQSGVMINLFVESGKIRFQINLRQASAAQLRMSSKLLALARLVIA